MSYNANNPNGQATSANSSPMVLASDQPAIPITGAVPANTFISGTFTAVDNVVPATTGDGATVVGTSPAGSVFAIAVPDGFQSWTSLMLNYFDGVVYSEASTNTTNGIDGNWIDLKGRQTGVKPGVEVVTYAQTANTYFRGAIGGFKYFRLRFVGGTVFPSVRIDLSVGQAAVFLNSGIPGGGSFVGFENLQDARGYRTLIDPSGNLQTESLTMQKMLLVNIEILRQLTKLQLMQAISTSQYIDDDCIDPQLLN